MPLLYSKTGEIEYREQDRNREVLVSIAEGSTVSAGLHCQQQSPSPRAG